MYLTDEDAPSLFSVHQADARGGAQGGRYRRKYRDGEVDDFLPKFFLYYGRNHHPVNPYV